MKDFKASAQDLFDQLKPEEEREPSRRPFIERKRNLDTLIRKFELLLSEHVHVELPPFYQDKIHQAIYRKYRCDKQAQRCDATELLELFLILSAYQDRCVDYYQFKVFSAKLGGFMSYLFNHAPGTRFYLTTDHLRSPIDNLGYKNTKDITVVGDVGNDFCTRMKNGTVTLKGDAWNHLGDEMQGGTIVIDGDVEGSSLGFSMKGGTIKVLGDCKKQLGEDLSPRAFVREVMGNRGDNPYFRKFWKAIGFRSDPCRPRMAGGTIIYQQHVILENGVFKA